MQGVESPQGKIAAVLFIAPRPQLLEKAKAMKLNTVVVHQPDFFTEAHILFCDFIVMMDFTNQKAVLEKIQLLSKSFEFCGVVCNVEQGVGTAQRCAQMLNLPGNPPEVSNLLKDKLSLRKWLKKYPEMEVAAQEVNTASDLELFGVENGYPFIVKPTDGTASLGVMRVEHHADITTVSRKMTQMLQSTTHQYAQFFPLDHFLAERFLFGEEYSVEAFSFSGEHKIIAITQKLKNTNFVEVGHAVPASLTDSQTITIQQFVINLLNAIGVMNGPSHTEIIIENGQPYLVESHDRIGGDRIADLIALAAGIDLEEWLISCALGKLETFHQQVNFSQAAATKFIIIPPGRISTITGQFEAQQLLGIVDIQIDVNTQSRITPLEASWGRAGQIIAEGPTIDIALLRCQQAIDVIDIEAMES